VRSSCDPAPSMPPGWRNSTMPNRELASSTLIALAQAAMSDSPRTRFHAGTNSGSDEQLLRLPGRAMTAASVVIFLCVVAVCCVRGADRKQPGAVTVNISGSTVQSGSNMVTFTITNAFEFPIRFGVAALTKEGTKNWRTVYSSGSSVVLLRGQIPARGATNLVWSLPPTNRWKIEVSYNDARSLSKGRAQGYVSSPEMEGDALIPPGNPP
jgi:hypothetical protein